MDVQRLDCNACKSRLSMVPGHQARFGGLIQLIGLLIAIPSALGALFGLMAFFSAASTGTGAGAGVGIVLGGGIAIPSLIGGVVGWLLLSTRSVWKCERCSFLLDRAN